MRWTWCSLLVISGCSFIQPLFEDWPEEETPAAESIPEPAAVPETAVAEAESVTVTVGFMRDPALYRQRFVARRLERTDFAPILRDGYVNYADDQNAELLSLHNDFQRQETGHIRDYWGNPLFGDWTGGPTLTPEGTPRYRVFEVVVENRRTQKIRLDPDRMVVVDDRGEQVSPLPRDQLMDELERHWAAWSLSPRALEMPGVSREYYLRSSARLTRSLFTARAVFPGATVRGLVVFASFPSDSGRVTFIVPDVEIRSSDGGFTDYDFILDFNQQQP